MGKGPTVSVKRKQKRRERWRRRKREPQRVTAIAVSQDDDLPFVGVARGVAGGRGEITLDARGGWPFVAGDTIGFVGPDGASFEVEAARAVMRVSQSQPAALIAAGSLVAVAPDGGIVAAGDPAAPSGPIIGRTLADVADDGEVEVQIEPRYFSVTLEKNAPSRIPTPREIFALASEAANGNRFPSVAVFDRILHRVPHTVTRTEAIAAAVVWRLTDGAKAENDRNASEWIRDELERRALHLWRAGLPEWLQVEVDRRLEERGTWRPPVAVCARSRAFALRQEIERDAIDLAYTANPAISSSIKPPSLRDLLGLAGGPVAASQFAGLTDETRALWSAPSPPSDGVAWPQPMYPRPLLRGAREILRAMTAMRLAGI